MILILHIRLIFWHTETLKTSNIDFQITVVLSFYPAMNEIWKREAFRWRWPIWKGLCGPWSWASYRIDLLFESSKDTSWRTPHLCFISRFPQFFGAFSFWSEQLHADHPDLWNSRCKTYTRDDFLRSRCHGCSSCGQRTGRGSLAAQVLHSPLRRQLGLVHTGCCQDWWPSLQKNRLPNQQRIMLEVDSASRLLLRCSHFVLRNCPLVSWDWLVEIGLAISERLSRWSWILALCWCLGHHVRAWTCWCLAETYQQGG